MTASIIDYGTFTAFNGERVFPQLMEFRGESTIDISLITGDCAKNKGMALFPRRIRGKYAMISRIDNENLLFHGVRRYLGLGAGLRHRGPQVPLAGHSDRQLRIANRNRGRLAASDSWCRTDAPLLYWCDAARSPEPCQRDRQTREPLIVPSDDERTGYVPNVVYSCGAMLHNGMLIVPYALSDLSTSMARIDLDELLSALVPP